MLGRLRLGANRERSLAGFSLAATVLIACAALAVGLEIRERRSFDTLHGPITSTPGGSSSHAATSLATAGAAAAVRSPTIGLIGDSWVSAGKLDAPLAKSLADLGLHDLRVRGFGHPGANSRQILRDLVSDESEKYSSAALLDDASVRYCIVIAGVNDTGGYVGSDFYAHHMVQIVRTLLDRGIRPLIVEVPEYGIGQVPRSPLSIAKAALFRTLFDAGEVDPVLRYRAALEQSLLASGLRDDVTMIDFESVAVDYERSAFLYKDPSHLNEVGQRLLARLIAQTVAREPLEIRQPPRLFAGPG